MKKFAIILVVLLIIVIGLVAYFKFYGSGKANFNEDLISVNNANDTSMHSNLNEIANEVENEKNNNELKDSSSSSTNIPTTKTSITKDEALAALQDKFGTKDEQTGNTMSYAYLAQVQDKDGKKYYAYRESWLVDNSHMSFLQNIFISLDGKTVKVTGDPKGYEENEVVDLSDAETL